MSSNSKERGKWKSCFEPTVSIYGAKWKYFFFFLSFVCTFTIPFQWKQCSLLLSRVLLKEWLWNFNLLAEFIVQKTINLPELSSLLSSMNYCFKAKLTLYSSLKNFVRQRKVKNLTNFWKFTQRLPFFYEFFLAKKLFCHFSILSFSCVIQKRMATDSNSITAWTHKSEENNFTEMVFAAFLKGAKERESEFLFGTMILE